MQIQNKLALLLTTLFVVGCAGNAANFDLQTQTVAYKELETIQAPEGDPVIIAVYDFMDMTGQKKPGGQYASMSSAVTQGSYQILIKALQDAGKGKWFRVVERASLAALLQERKLIRTTRQMSDGEEAEPLPALLFAGAYVTGGIVGYDSDVVSGGAGARVLGIGVHKEYRQDIISIVLRLINVQTGEVIISTVIEKTIFSTSTGGDVFKYADAGTMLVEIEAGYAVELLVIAEEQAKQDELDILEAELKAEEEQQIKEEQEKLKQELDELLEEESTDENNNEVSADPVSINHHD
jgi:curli production assembly/transport component CsgG